MEDDFENEMDHTDSRLDEMEFDEDSYPQGFDEDYSEFEGLESFEPIERGPKRWN